MDKTNRHREHVLSPGPVLRWGSDLTEDDLARIFDLAVERFPSHAGNPGDMAERFRLNPEAFHAVFDDVTGCCMAFFVLLPLSAPEFGRTLSPGILNIDQELDDGHLLQFDPAKQTEYDVYLASIVMRERGSGKTVASILIQQFFDFIQCLALERGILVRRLSAEAITPQGRHLCEKQLKLKMLHERGNGARVYAGGMRETLRHIQDDLHCFYPGRYAGLMLRYGL